MEVQKTNREREKKSSPNATKLVWGVNYVLAISKMAPKHST
jgi:hypothetical protein